ncbi:MAG: crossover junction endodeoxyribonuclease RuvC [Clostridia bacterium]|jgi:crossover junction endodeoxyribonuclease RuvC|nr:crossover junction endodeoxyribonuclease RuvC [Clostridia bacterium]
MKVLGLDPGYGTLGYGVIEGSLDKCKLIAYGAIITPKSERFPERLRFIGEKIIDLNREFCPDEIALEELFFQKNAKTAIMVAEARGVILYECESFNIPLFEYTPLQIKQSLTGYGRADKKQIQEMVKVLLKMEKIPKPDDAADALAVAITHIQTNKIFGNYKI